MLPSETMIWQPEFTDKTLSRKPGAVQYPGFTGGSNELLFKFGRIIRGNRRIRKKSYAKLTVFS
ncbi:TPA: hypothetical protein HML79_25195 [Escherichia coli]|nr:hypothetical protein [Escherichia coli]